MNHDFPHRSQQDEGDPLDGLLETARWPEPNADAERRLAAHWQQCRALERRRRWSRWIAAAAAGLLVVAALWWYRVVSLDEPAGPAEGNSSHMAQRPVVDSPGEPLVESPEPANINASNAAESNDEIEPPADSLAEADTQVADNAPDAPPAFPPPRAANAYELLMLQAASRKARPQVEAVRHEILTGVLDQLVANPDVDVAETAQPLLAAKAQYEALLIRTIGDLADQRQIAAIRLTGVIGSQSSVPYLMKLREQQPTHRAAVQALTRLADSSTLVALARAESDLVLLDGLVAELLRRGNRSSVRAYLQLVADTRMRQDALLGMEVIEKPPVDVLFGFLASHYQWERTAAAMALGRSNDPAVTDRLIELAMSFDTRQEALLALLASDTFQAREFLNHARRDAMLMAAVESARVQLQFAAQ